jgi:hypothetical protein
MNHGIVKMKNSETGSDGILVQPRPLFASTWMALFYMLRKNYNERHFVGPENAECSQATEKNKSGKKLN